MLIRELRLDDISTLLEMATREEGFHVSEEAPYFWSREQLERWIGAGEDILLGAEVEGKLAGFVLTTLHRPTGKVTWENQLVLSEYRRKGLANGLIDEMRKRLKEKGATYIHFLVKTDNVSTRYYENAGFTRGFDFVWFDQNL